MIKKTFLILLLLAVGCKKKEKPLIWIHADHPQPVIEIIEERPRKWELAEHNGTKFVVARRSLDNSTFEPMIECDGDEKNCRYKISADEMAKELSRIFKACR